MTARVNALTVILDDDIRTDDIEPLITAISMLKNVVCVQQHFANWEADIAQERALLDIRKQIQDILWPFPQRRNYGE